MERSEKMREIPIQTEQTRFEAFLATDNNKQILFSGIYGSGKTYFLNKFFEKRPEQYEPIFISPVNYPVASNEDIFEYIKVEILIGLFKRNTHFNTEKFPLSLVAQTALEENWFSILSSALENIPAVKMITSPLLLSLKKIMETQNGTKTDEKAIALSFLEECKKHKGSIFEKDDVTLLIRKLVERYEEESKKEIVLIIDDLDRLDPDHVFRILNILSVHNNYNDGNDHKFGISKTILVCDIDNIKHIFHGRYGEKVDFEGYIDKFFSTRVFYFDNVENIKKEISNILAHASCDVDLEIHFDEHAPFGYVVRMLLLFFIIKNRMNLRKLLSCENNSIEIKNHTHEIQGTRKIEFHNHPVMVAFKYVEIVCGSIEKLKSVIDDLKESDFNEYDTRTMCYHLLFYADYDKKNPISEGGYKYQDVKYTICAFNDAQFDKDEIECKSISHTQLLQDVFATYKKHFR